MQMAQTDRRVGRLVFWPEKRHHYYFPGDKSAKTDYVRRPGKGGEIAGSGCSALRRHMPRGGSRGGDRPRALFGCGIHQLTNDMRTYLAATSKTFDTP